MPPSTASEVFSFFDNIDAPLGVGIITRLSDIGSGDDSNYRLSPP
jgi:hypothetical protein